MRFKPRSLVLCNSTKPPQILATNKTKDYYASINIFPQSGNSGLHLGSKFTPPQVQILSFEIQLDYLHVGGIENIVYKMSKYPLNQVKA